MLDTFTFWHWWVLAGILFAFEVAAPGVFFLFVGIGAVVSGIVAVIWPAMGWESEAVIMIAVALATALAGRRYYPRIQANMSVGTLNRRASRCVGRIVTLEQPIADGKGRVELDGSHWAVSGADAPAGAKVRVVAFEGTVLKVVPE